MRLLTRFLWILWLARSGTVGAAAAVPEHHVQKGDSCPDLARRFYGDRRRIDVIHEANPWLGPPPHRLQAGWVLRMPPPGAKRAADALLSTVRNRVDTFTPAQRPGRKDEPLQRGNKVSTLGASSAEISFTDETLLQLGEHSLVVILGDGAGQARRQTAADTTLVHGTLRAHLGELIGKPTPPVALSTPGAKVRLGRGESQIQVDERRTTRLSVYRGSARLNAAGREVTVPAGFGTRAEEGKAPARPRLLPPAPEWATLPPRLVLTLGPEVEVRATYRAEAAATFRVQLAREERFGELVVDERVPAKTKIFSAKGLAPGRYFVRVAAIDGEGMEGGPSAVAAVTVIALPVEHNWGRRSAISVPPGTTCGLDGGPPQEGGRLELSPVRRHKVRCTLAGDSASEALLTMLPAQAGALQVRVESDAPVFARGSGERTVRLLLTDGADAPLRGALVTATAALGELSPVEERDGPGIYTTRLRFQQGPGAALVRFVVNGAVTVGARVATE